MNQHKINSAKREPDIAPALAFSFERTNLRRLIVDRLGRYLVTAGGWAIVLSILAILTVLLIETFPLFEKPTLQQIGSTSIGSNSILAGSVDEYREQALLIAGNSIEFVNLKTGLREQLDISPLAGAQIQSAVRLDGRTFVLGTSDGRLIPLSIDVSISFEGEIRKVKSSALLGTGIEVGQSPVIAIAGATRRGGKILISQTKPDSLTILWQEETHPLIGTPTISSKSSLLPLPKDVSASRIILDQRGDNLFVGTTKGELLRYSLDAESGATLAERIAGSDSTGGSTGAPISMLGFLIGERTLITGDSAGHVRSWMLVREPGSVQEKLRQIYNFPPHNAAVTTFSRSERNKSFVTGDESGTIHLNYGTSGERLLTEVLAKGPISLLLLSPKSDGILALSPGGTLSNFELINRHPEATFKTIFGKTWYEGYSKPEYVWQSTGGTDDFEPKYSLVPLIFGTLKGTFFAMLFAVPIALLSALYTSQFMNRNLRAWVKPIVELLAAVPSVVIGFIAGLWLAPKVAHYAPGIFLLPVVAPMLILSVALLASNSFAKRLLAHRPILELALLTLTALAALGISFTLGGVVEREFMGGSFESWLSGTLGITYDQRNSLVIGIAMGFAVIPLIFTLTEDCLSSVPRHLTAGSLALGATRWQTALKIVLPTASPGIFSAMMIGLGRAVGETMIVLMATGNTPVMNWSIFNGFRALSANIAVELPEAPDGGTLYRVLFLAALLLFLMTFAVNTVSELIRLRLRKKYEHL